MILLINQFTTPLFVDIVNAFQERNGEVTYITGRLDISDLKLNKQTRIVKSISYNRSNFLSRFTTWTVFTFHAFIYLLFCKKPSGVVVATNPPFAPWIVSLLGKWRDMPFYVVVYDLYPEVLSQTGVLQVENPIYRIWQKINFYIFARARKVVTLSDSMKNAVASYVGRDMKKITIVHNWADTRQVVPLSKDRNPFVTRNNLEKKIVVLYAGNMGLTHDLESLMKAAIILKNSDRIQFVFIGNGGKRRQLEELKSNENLDNVLFLPFQDSREFPLAMAAGDIGVVTLGLGAEGISVPSKTYVNMAAGLCLLAIAPEESELTRIVKFYDAGVAVEPDNPEKVADLILHLATNLEILDRLKKNSRRASVNFTPENAYRYVEVVSGQLAVDNCTVSSGLDAIDKK